MTARQHEAPDCAGRNGVRNWTVHQYGYERYVVLNERGHEVAATHRRDTARLIAAAPELLEVAKAAERKLVELRSLLADHGIPCPCTDEIVCLQDALIKAGA